MRSGWSTTTPPVALRSGLTNGVKSTQTHLWSLAMPTSGTKGTQFLHLLFSIDPQSYLILIRFKYKPTQKSNIQQYAMYPEMLVHVQVGGGLRWARSEYEVHRQVGGAVGVWRGMDKVGRQVGRAIRPARARREARRDVVGGTSRRAVEQDVGGGAQCFWLGAQVWPQQQRRALGHASGGGDLVRALPPLRIP